VGILALWIFSLGAAACDLAATVKDADVNDIKSFFDSQNKDVTTFAGYSGAEYEDKTAMLEKAGRVLSEFDASKTIVNIGATPEGIGAVYELAKRSGFLTTGILSTRAKKYNAALSPCVDYVFYVDMLPGEDS
jgi:transaldolase